MFLVSISYLVCSFNLQSVYYAKKTTVSFSVLVFLLKFRFLIWMPLSEFCKAPPLICSRRQFQFFSAFSKITNNASYFMRNVCWQTFLMKYHTSFFSKIRKGVAKFVVSVANCSCPAIAVSMLSHCDQLKQNTPHPPGHLRF